MGATSGYHPISLHVIRGAAEFCGFKFGQIRRIASMPTEGRAVYACVLEKGPKGWRDWPLKTLVKQLNNCFMADVRVKDITARYSGMVVVVLSVQLARSPLDMAIDAQIGGEK